jgi:hypothetical protein
MKGLGRGYVHFRASGIRQYEGEWNQAERKRW